jgi:hypothetical protein
MSIITSAPNGAGHNFDDEVLSELRSGHRVAQRTRHIDHTPLIGLTRRTRVGNEPMRRPVVIRRAVRSPFPAFHRPAAPKPSAHPSAPIDRYGLRGPYSVADLDRLAELEALPPDQRWRAFDALPLADQERFWSAVERQGRR